VQPPVVGNQNRIFNGMQTTTPQIFPSTPTPQYSPVRQSPAPRIAIPNYSVPAPSAPAARVTLTPAIPYVGLPHAPALGITRRAIAPASNPFVGVVGAPNTSHPAVSPQATSTPPANPFTSVLAHGAKQSAVSSPNPQTATPNASNPYTSALSPTNRNTTTQFNASMATVSGHEYLPISQRAASNYTGDTFQADSRQACLATVYTMAVRGATGKNVPINNFYDANQGAMLPNNMTRGPLTNNLMILESGPQLLMIKGTANTEGGTSVDHYMLGTFVSNQDGRKVISANDPYSGVQVTIDAQTGRVVSPPAGYTNIDFTADAFRTLTVN
jgi:hypothetical protein